MTNYEVTTLCVSGVAIGISIFACYRSSEANRISKEANEISKEASKVSLHNTRKKVLKSVKSTVDNCDSAMVIWDGNRGENSTNGQIYILINNIKEKYFLNIEYMIEELIGDEFIFQSGTRESVEEFISSIRAVLKAFNKFENLNKTIYVNEKNEESNLLLIAGKDIITKVSKLKESNHLITEIEKEMVMNLK